MAVAVLGKRLHMRKNYYEILQINPSDSPDAIKKAYRKLSKKNHPDMNNGCLEAAERFKEINEAYRTLSDPEKRKQYDIELGRSSSEHIGTNSNDWIKPLFNVAAVIVLICTIVFLFSKLNREINS
jgi:DnaJ-class molecular chaperone